MVSDSTRFWMVPDPSYSSATSRASETRRYGILGL
uniref:Uncharacterized protein n=1 Tax=Arundo donax TaxID=35708 RepID=A0A0A9BIR4_ARUDO